MNESFDKYMKIAISEAKESLKERNHGFGAVIIKGDQILAQAHDQEESNADPTSHAELNAIRLAAQRYGRNFEDCVLISTYEPCPMCATAIIWSGIKTLVYGYSIKEAIKDERKRIDLTCRELFARANSDIKVHEGVSHDQCSLFYRKEVRDEIKRLRGAGQKELKMLCDLLSAKRIDWFQKNAGELMSDQHDLLFNGYMLLLKKLALEPDKATIVSKTENKIVFHSKNFCPTLEACKILNLDTRVICREVNEKPTTALLKQLDERLEFGRNYDKLRPDFAYCEEMVFIKTKA